MIRRAGAARGRASIRPALPSWFATVLRALALCLPVLPISQPLRAQSTPPRPDWEFTGRLSTVFASGNSESSTFGIGATLRRSGGRHDIKFEVGGVRTESARTTRRAVGSSADYDVEENTNWRKTAEAVFGRIRYGRQINGSFLVFGGVDWLRNTFAGIDSRLLIASGAGNVWADSEDFRFKTDYGVTYTFQNDVVENPFLRSKFPGLRFSWDMMRRLTETTQLESTLVTDLNIENTRDVRADFTNGLTLAIYSALALKPSVQLQWRNDPALTEIELFDDGGLATGEKVRVPLNRLDTFVTIALVVTL
jgi:putative salt-induced outer membrane protein YdiY